MPHWFKFEILRSARLRLIRSLCYLETNIECLKGVTEVESIEIHPCVTAICILLRTDETNGSKFKNFYLPLFCLCVDLQCMLHHPGWRLCFSLWRPFSLLTQGCIRICYNRPSTRRIGERDGLFRRQVIIHECPASRNNWHCYISNWGLRHTNEYPE